MKGTQIAICVLLAICSFERQSPWTRLDEVPKRFFKKWPSCAEIFRKHSVSCFGLGFQTAALQGGANFDAVLGRFVSASASEHWRSVAR